MNNKKKQRKSKEKTEHIPKDAVAYYLPTPNSERIYFTRDTILLMYHLIR